jgi:glycogen(starch) synthase
MLVSVRANTDTRPLRILMTTDAVGGVWQYTVDLVRALADRGAEVLVAVLGPGPSHEQRNELQSLARILLAEKNFALEWEPNSWADVDASGEWLLQLDAQFRADVIHLNGYSHAALPWHKPVVSVAHSCVYSWWRNVLNSAPGPEWAEYKSRVTAGLLACQTIVAPTQFMAAEIQREYGVSSEKVRVIYNFSTRGTAAIAEKQRFFFAAGRVWDPAKNFALLEEVAPHLNWPVQLAGSSKGEISSAPGLQNLGHIPTADLLELMARASVFVHPALYEPFGLSVLDAARARCCLVLADTPSMRELWEDSAMFVDPRKPNSWIEELNALSRDSPRCKELGDRAFSRAGRYAVEASVRGYQALYADLIARTGNKAEEAA